MAAGERPENVRIVDKVTGEVTPCELAYNKFDPLRQLIRVGRLPGKTAIMFPTQPGGGGKG